MAYTGLTAKLSVVEESVGANNAVTTNVKDVAYISNWSVEETRDVVEITRFGEMAKEKRPALYSWTAGADGTADFADTDAQAKLRKAMLDGKAVKVRFYLDASSETPAYMEGEAYIDSLSVDVSAEDKANVSVSLNGTGVLKYTGMGDSNGTPAA